MIRRPAMGELLVLADDRTGALETGAALADWGLEVEVRTLQAPAGSMAAATDCLVIDHDARRWAGATRRVRDAVAAGGGGWARRAHKIDSTLRGHWAEEAATLRGPAGRVLLVPAFPGAGRTCVQGVVFDHGIPVAEGPAGRDPVAPVRESRPAAYLRAHAPAGSLDELSGPDEARAWLASGRPGFAVCDAGTDDELLAIAAAWVDHPDVVLSGPAAAIAAGGAALTGRARRGTGPAIDGSSALVVCGSAHPAARAQVAELARAGWPVEVVELDGDGTGPSSAPPPARLALVAPERTVTGAGDHRWADAVAARARDVGARRSFATVVVIGGETATAVLGPAPVRVLGSLGPGIAVARWAVPAGPLGDPLLVTKPGGFGDEAVLRRLLDARMGA